MHGKELMGKVDEEGNIYTIKIDEFGNKLWYKNDKRHRDGGPAIIWPCGNKYWYDNGDFVGRLLCEKCKAKYPNRDFKPEVLYDNTKS